MKKLLLLSLFFVACNNPTSIDQQQQTIYADVTGRWNSSPEEYVLSQSGDSVWGYMDNSNGRPFFDTTLVTGYVTTDSLFLTVNYYSDTTIHRYFQMAVNDSSIVGSFCTLTGSDTTQRDGTDYWGLISR